MKKILALGMSALFLLLTVAGCSADSAAGDKINLISREDGSGTRGAFIELFGIEEKDADGNQVDRTSDRAEITSSTSVMMVTVAGDPSAIGYISLGSLNDTVKAVGIDGTAPSVESIKDGSYTISRPFNIATKGELSPVAADFVAFIMSADGQNVVEEKGYIRVDDSGAFGGGQPSGSIAIAGSSSVTPVMEALKEAYEKRNPGAKIEIQQSDSTTGMNSVIEGICDIGMASRAVKDSETEKGLAATVIALDGIAVIVNNDSAVENLTKDQVMAIYTGEISEWSAIK